MSDCRPRHITTKYEGWLEKLFVNTTWTTVKAGDPLRSPADLRDAIYHGAVKRVRPKAMTAAVIIAGLLPILWSHGTGADTMKRIALPMVGGVITSTLMELLVYPAIFFLWRSRAMLVRPLGQQLPRRA